MSDKNIENPEYVRDLRCFAYGLRISSHDWLEFLTDLYRDYPGRIIDARGAEVFLNMEEFETAGIREWFRDFCCTLCPPDVTPRVRPEAWERVRALATILRAHFPEAAMVWGVRAANDNEPR
nr:hypothetical protein [Nitrosomonas nitrosa]